LAKPDVSEKIMAHESVALNMEKLYDWNFWVSLFSHLFFASTAQQQKRFKVKNSKTNSPLFFAFIYSQIQ
jgi:hypothetical protein